MVLYERMNICKLFLFILLCVAKISHKMYFKIIQNTIFYIKIFIRF